MIIAAIPSRWLSGQVGDAERAFHLNVLCSSAVLLGVLSVSLPHGGGFCLFDSCFGVPGPFCFITRSVHAALQLNLPQAAILHPIGPVIAFLFVTQLVLRPIALVQPRLIETLSSPRMARRVNLGIIAGCILIFAVRVLAG